MDLAKIRKKAKAAMAPRGAADNVSPVPAPKSPLPPAAPPTETAAPLRAPDPEPPPEPPPRPSPALPVLPAPPPAPEKEEAAPAGPACLEKLLVFAVGPRRYAIPIHDISQIIEEQPVTPVPHAPAFLLGIFSLRGRIVSVFDAGRRLGLPAKETDAPAKVVVLDMGEELFGVRVHGIDQVAEVDLGALEPPPESFRALEQEFVEGVFHLRERTVSFLNLPLFLAFESGGKPA